MIKNKEAITDEEIRAAINIAPGFKSFEPGEQDKLPGVTLMVGQPYIYKLPGIKEWNEKDKVDVGIIMGHHLLAECNCVTLIGKEAIRIDLPSTYVGISSTITISLNDGLEESYYYLIIAGRPFVPSNI